MPTPMIAQRSPYAIEVEAGKTYFWCACGGSKNQPCCGCKHSKNQPLCDGTHAKT